MVLYSCLLLFLISSRGITSTKPREGRARAFCAQLDTRWGQLGIVCCVDAPGGAEDRARPARHGASERAGRPAFREGKFPASGPPPPQGARLRKLDLPPASGFDPGFRAPPQSPGFSKAWPDSRPGSSGAGAAAKSSGTRSTEPPKELMRSGPRGERAVGSSAGCGRAGPPGRTRRCVQQAEPGSPVFGQAPVAS